MNIILLAYNYPNKYDFKHIIYCLCRYYYIVLEIEEAIMLLLWLNKLFNELEKKICWCEEKMFKAFVLQKQLVPTLKTNSILYLTGNT